MSSSTAKNPKPTLAGQRIRTRKRDEKVKHDPEAFREEIVKGLEKSGSDFDEAAKFLDGAGSTQDYHRYAETLFDILISGGILAPGGEVTGVPAALSVFQRPLVDTKQFAGLLLKLIRRYKYMQVSLEEEMAKVLKFLKTFSPENRQKLAHLLALLIKEALVTAKPLESLTVEACVKDGLSLEFLVVLMRAWLAEAPMSTISSALRKEKIDLLDLCPPARRTQEHFRQYCVEAGGLDELVSWQVSQQSRDHLRQLQRDVADQLSAGTPLEEIAHRARDAAAAASIVDVDVVDRLVNAALDAVDWSKRAEQQPDQALRQIKAMIPLFTPFCKTQPTQLALVVRLQTYCYDNPALTKTFHKLVILLYKADVVGEEAILKWHDGGSSTKGRSGFLEQMQEMVDWLKNAEEESSEEEEEEEGAAAK